MLDATSLVKQLQEMRDGGYLSDAILRRAVRTIAESDDRFDWVGIYLHKPAEQELWLHNYRGTPTEHARIKVGEGVCGAAVAEARNQNVPDVTQIDNYIACSPGTQSELVILIRAGDEILGQIDLDSDRKDAFTEQDETAIQAVADKLAEVLVAERE